MTTENAKTCQRRSASSYKYLYHSPTTETFGSKESRQLSTRYQVNLRLQQSSAAKNKLFTNMSSEDV